MAIITETRYATTDADVAELSAEESAAVTARAKALRLLLEEENRFRPRYRLELFFGAERSARSAVPGMLTFWESGSQLHGGGDARVYLCPGKLVGKNDCSAPIPFDIASKGVFACPACKTVWEENRRRVIGEVLGRHTMQQWATLLLRYFRVLGQDCDITIKYAPEDIRSKALAEQARDHRGELLGKARRRAVAVYPLKHIIKDLNAGADPYGRMFAFVTA